MPQPPERIAEDQPISFSKLGRYSRWEQRDTNALASHCNHRAVWSADLLNEPLHSAARPTRTDHSFDMRKARAVLERQ